jgi:hypothetical protein
MPDWRTDGAELQELTKSLGKAIGLDEARNIVRMLNPQKDSMLKADVFFKWFDTYVERPSVDPYEADRRARLEAVMKNMMTGDPLVSADTAPEGDEPVAAEEQVQDEVAANSKPTLGAGAGAGAGAETEAEPEPEPEPDEKVARWTGTSDFWSSTRYLVVGLECLWGLDRPTSFRCPRHHYPAHTNKTTAHKRQKLRSATH